jgi:hypothetical protein
MVVYGFAKLLKKLIFPGLNLGNYRVVEAS